MATQPAEASQALLHASALNAPELAGVACACTPAAFVFGNPHKQVPVKK